MEADPGQPADLIGIGDLVRRADGGDAPADTEVEVQAVGLEGNHRPAGRGGQLAAVIGLDDDVAAIESEIDQLHRRQRLPGIDDPAHGDRGHQLETFIAGQLLHSGAVGVHRFKDARSEPARPRVQSPYSPALPASCWSPNTRAA